MNKVINIELAGQVFWVEEAGFEVLDAYLVKLDAQLRGRELGDEVFKDIELRLAELFYESLDSPTQVITLINAQEVVAQVGDLDGDDLNTDVKRRSYRDLRNKMLGGVCAGLGKRFSIPPLYLRLLFVLLACVVGVGFVAYVALWLSLEKDTTRTAYLTAQGQRPTAKLIASVNPSKKEKTTFRQKLLFFPFYILGRVIAALTGEYRRREYIYNLLFKTLCVFTLVAINIFVIYSLINFSGKRLLALPALILVDAAVIALLIALSSLIAQRFIFSRSKPRNLGILLAGIGLPVTIILGGVFYLEKQNSHEHQVVREKSYFVSGQALEVRLSADHTENAYPSLVDTAFVVDSSLINTITLQVQYFARGENLSAAEKNIFNISFSHEFSDGVLFLDQYFSLADDSLYRGQRLRITILLPPGITLTVPTTLTLESKSDRYRYIMALTTDSQDPDESSITYLSVENHLHNIGFLNGARADSANELVILKERFCQSFYSIEVWRCSKKRILPAADSTSLLPNFRNYASEINAIRDIIETDDNIDVGNLQLLKERTAVLKIPGNEQLPMVRYIDHVLRLVETYSQP